MVWIHGGGWQFGSAESYNGAALAKYGDVVVVVISYRYGFKCTTRWSRFKRLNLTISVTEILFC